MRRLNFTLDDSTALLLDRLAERLHGGNKSRTIRAAVESLAAQVGQDGWVIRGFTPTRIDAEDECHRCHSPLEAGATVYKPVFERGSGPNALRQLPHEEWLDCESCVDQEIPESK
jgi:hypothetical protein